MTFFSPMEEMSFEAVLRPAIANSPGLSTELRTVQSERDRWYVFLRSHAESSGDVGIVDDLVAEYAIKGARDMPLPKTTIEDDGIRLEWTSPRLYLEIEIRDGAIASWFFRDTATRRTHDGEDADPRKLLGLIERFDTPA